MLFAIIDNVGKHNNIEHAKSCSIMIGFPNTWLAIICITSAVHTEVHEMYNIVR